MTRDAPPLVTLRPFGEGAILVELGAEATLAGARRAAALARAVTGMRDRDARWKAPVPGAASVLVPFDPLALDMAEAGQVLRALADAVPADPGPPGGRRTRDVTVRFGGDDGPDLAAVAGRLRIRADALVARLVAHPLEVLFLGFAPGFPYLGPLPDDLVLPRLATPRTRVPAGSVAIAGPFAGIYPQDSPGGWHVLGRTDLRLFDPAADPPALLRPGDAVRLVPA